MANVLISVVWAFGALAMLMEAPSCPGFMGMTTRLQSAVAWPLIVAANSVRASVGAPPRYLTCRNGSLGSWDLQTTER